MSYEYFDANRLSVADGESSYMENCTTQTVVQVCRGNEGS